MIKGIYQTFVEAAILQQKLFAILIDPDKFNVKNTRSFLRKLPVDTTHILAGGSTVKNGRAQEVIKNIKLYSARPVIIFPGDYSQISDEADGLLFLSLLSGRNPEYLIEQQVRAVKMLRKFSLETIATGYILVDGGNTSSVERVTQTKPISQSDIQLIVDTAKAGELLGSKLIYLEAGSGALQPVNKEIISAVKQEIKIPLLVGGGIKTEEQKQDAYQAGADMVIMGTAYEL